MGVIEIALITIGLSLDAFAVVGCQGAVVARLEKKQLAIAVALIAIWQTIALLVGDLLVTLLNRFDTHLNAKSMIEEILAALIFLGLGLRMFKKALKNEKLIEKRQDKLNLKKIFALVAKGTACTILVGVAFAFLATDIKTVLLLLACITVGMVIIGLYIGYRFGFEKQSKAYVAGGALFVVAGIDVVAQYICLVDFA